MEKIADRLLADNQRYCFYCESFFGVDEPCCDHFENIREAIRYREAELIRRRR
jgi:hypothetical protein